jgi:hypothetical protein
VLRLQDDAGRSAHTGLSRAPGHDRVHLPWPGLRTTTRGCIARGLMRSGPRFLASDLPIESVGREIEASGKQAWLVGTSDNLAGPLPAGTSDGGDFRLGTDRRRSNPYRRIVPSRASGHPLDVVIGRLADGQACCRSSVVKVSAVSRE